MDLICEVELKSISGRNQAGIYASCARFRVTICVDLMYEDLANLNYFDAICLLNRIGLNDVLEDLKGKRMRVAWAGTDPAVCLIKAVGVRDTFICLSIGGKVGLDDPGLETGR